MGCQRQNERYVRTSVEGPARTSPAGGVGAGALQGTSGSLPCAPRLEVQRVCRVRKERPNFKPPPQLPAFQAQIPARVLPNTVPQPPELSRRGLPLKAPPCKSPPAKAAPEPEKKAPPASVKGIQPASPAPPPGLNATWASNLFKNLFRSYFYV